MTAGPLLLTVDLGTTNCKAVASTLDGRVRAAATAGYPTANPREGWYEQRLDDWRRVILDVLSSVASALGADVTAVAGICLSAWGPGLVLLDEGGAPLNDTSPTWQDTRSREHGRRLVETAGAEWVGGGLPLTGFPAKLAWAVDTQPDITNNAVTAVGVKDYVLHWLTGVLATDPSSGPYALKWPEHVFGAIGWDTHRLPPVFEPTAVVGRLLEERAAECGLPPLLPVVCGLNDGAAATLGVGASRRGDAVVSLGTNGVLRLLTTTPPTPELCLNRSLFRYPVVGELWACGGFVLTGGGALAWATEAMAGDSASATIDTVLREAEDVPPGSDDLLFLPYLVGKGSPEPAPDASAAFLGLRLRHRRGHLVRAVLEGVAFGVRDIAEELRFHGFELEQLLLTGGGAASPLWRRIFSGVLGMPARSSTGDANLGSAAVLAAGIGLAPDVRTALDRLRVATDEARTEPEWVDVYDDCYLRFRGQVARAVSEGRP